jgi:hypothetical protein
MLLETSILEGNSSMNLKPWREIAEPHSDVREGKFQQAEFAADLSRVHAGTANAEYQNPALFFQRAFITEGMRLLLDLVVKRLVDDGLVEQPRGVDVLLTSHERQLGQTRLQARREQRPLQRQFDVGRRCSNSSRSLSKRLHWISKRNPSLRKVVVLPVWAIRRSLTIRMH